MMNLCTDERTESFDVHVCISLAETGDCDNLSTASRISPGIGTSGG